MTRNEIIEVEFLNDNYYDVVKAHIKLKATNAYKLPRFLVKTSDLKDLEKPGVYFLFCENDDGSKGVYIGESENVRQRLMIHINDYDKGKEKYFWNTVIFVFNDELNKVDLLYLENRLFNEAKEINAISKKYSIYTSVTRNPANVGNIKTLEDIIEYTKKYVAVLGFGDVFKKTESPSVVLESLNVKENESINVTQLFSCDRSGSKGIGHYSNGGFIVLKGSRVGKISASFERIGDGYYLLRKDLENKGIIKNDLFINDYEFNSPSAAASVLIGNSANGRKEWIPFSQEVDKFLNSEITNNNKKASPFKFSMIGIKPGEMITFADDESITVEVYDDSKVRYNGKIWNLSPLAKELLHLSTNPQGPLHFKYKGELLTELRKRFGK